MAEPITVKNFREGQISIKDATAVTPLEYVVAYEDGDLNFSAQKAERVVVRDRGAIAGLRKTNDPVITGSFTVHMRKLADSSDATIVDVVERTNAWAAAVSTATAAFEQILYDLIFTVDSTALGDTADDVITFADCLLEWDFAEGDTNKITVNWECYGGYTRTGN